MTVLQNKNNISNNTSHDGLLMSSITKYNAQGFNGSDFTRNISIQMPLFLTHDVWVRHDYSLKDILKTLECFTAKHLWQCALLYDISASHSAIKFTFSHPEHFVFGSKTIVIQKIKKVLERMSWPKQGVLDLELCTHIPPLPKHIISKVDMQYLISNIPTVLPSTGKPTHYSSVFEWRDIYLVPFEMENDNTLSCVRVIPMEIFKASGRMNHNSLTHLPLSIMVKGKAYAGVEEWCLFTSK